MNNSKLSLRYKLVLYVLLALIITTLIEAVGVVIVKAVVIRFEQSYSNSNDKAEDKNYSNDLVFDDKASDEIPSDLPDKPVNKRKELGVVLIIAVTFIVIFTMVLYKLLGSVMRYIKEIDNGIKFINMSDFGQTIDERGNDELESIASGLNDISIMIKDFINDKENSEREKNELITSIAHDLRTPITSILGYMELVKNQNLDEETRARYIEVAYEKSERLRKLIEDLFVYTKFDFGEYTIKKNKLSMSELLMQCADEFYPVMETEGLKLELDFPKSPCFVYADGDLLVRVFINLIGNSVKYGKDGKKILVRLSKEASFYKAEIINYGKIIPKNDIDRVFDKFYRGDGSRNSSTGGTGLGLAIAKKITEIHHGEIGVTSGMNGTCFYVKIPVMNEDKNEKTN